MSKRMRFAKLAERQQMISIIAKIYFYFYLLLAGSRFALETASSSINYGSVKTLLVDIVALAIAHSVIYQKLYIPKYIGLCFSIYYWYVIISGLPSFLKMDKAIFWGVLIVYAPMAILISTYFIQAQKNTNNRLTIPR